MKVIGPYVISAVPHLHREVVNRAAGERRNAGGRGGAQASPPEHAPATRQNGQNHRARDQASRLGDTNGAGPDGSPNLVPTPLNSLPLHGIDRLTGMPVLLHRLSGFVVAAPLPDSPHLLPVTEVDIWDAHPYAVTELPPAAVLATHPVTAALGVLRALTALHAAGQVHGGLNAGQFWQVGREVRLAGAGLPWQPGAGTDADMHALGQALDTLGARPASLLKLEQMTARQALAALEGAMLQPEPVAAPEPATSEYTPLAQPQPELTRADLGWNAPTAPLAPPPPSEPVPSGPTQGNEAPAAKVTWNRRKTDRAAQATGSQTVPESQPRDAVAAQATARTVIAPIPEQVPEPSPEPISEPVPYRSAADIIVIADSVTTSVTTDAPQAGQAVSSDIADGGAPEGEPAPGDKVTSGQALNGAVSDASHEPAPAVRPVAAPIRIGFSELPETDVQEARAPEPLPSQTPERSEPVVLDLQMGRTIRFTPTSAPVQPTPPASEAAESGSPAHNPVQGAVARHGQLSPATATTNLSAATRMQPLRIGWEEDHSWRVVKSGPERRSALTRRFPSWLLALVLLALLSGTALWLLGRASPPSAACCSVNFTVSGGQGVRVTLVKAPPGSTLQPGAVIGTAPGLLNFPGVAGRYTLKFSAQDHGPLTATVNVPSSQPFAIVLK